MKAQLEIPSIAGENAGGLVNRAQRTSGSLDGIDVETVDEELARHADAVEMPGQRNGLRAGIGTFKAQTNAVARVEVLAQAVQVARGLQTTEIREEGRGCGRD